MLECRQANREVLSCSWLDEASICLHEFLIDLIDASQQPLAWRCWCVWRLSLSVDGQWGNVSGITLTHQPTVCVTEAPPTTTTTSRLLLQSVISSLCLKALPSFFVCLFGFAAALLGSSQNIARIPIEPLCIAKFKAIIQNMPEIAVQTLAVLQRWCLDEQEVVRCHQYNKQGFCLYPLLFYMPEALGAV